jgi:protein TonB
VTVVKGPVPQYPFSARRLGIEGTVLLRLLVNAQGLPEQIDVKKTSGSPVLDRAAESSLRRWRFRPAREAGTAVARWIEIAVCFKLTGPAPGYALGSASLAECRD